MGHCLFALKLDRAQRSVNLRIAISGLDALQAGILPRERMLSR
jgi:hypothetical protein